MNNFKLLIVDWDHFVGQFEADGVSQRLTNLKISGDHDQLSSASSSFLNDHLEMKSSIWDRDLDPCNPMVGASWVWYEFGETYSQMRTLLPADLMAHYDALYLPFLAPWVSAATTPNLMFQLPEEMGSLRSAGLSLAISPQHCKELDALARVYSFSYMIHSIACNKKESFPLRRSESWFNPCIDSQDSSVNTIHASYTEFTELLRKLVLRAARLGRGILAVAEI